MRSRWLGYFLAGVAVVLSIWAYPRLPPRVATHWNWAGEPGGFAAKWLAAGITPVVIVGLRGLMSVIRKINSGGGKYGTSADSFWLLVNGILLLLTAFHTVLIGYGLGLPVTLNGLVLIGIGLFFIVIGNYLGRAEPNRLIGIRTPWTLSSDRVWRATHRTGGWLFVIAGVVMIVSPVVREVAALLLAMILFGAVAIIATLQSYLLWKSETDANP